jgi:hypothetical protein
VAAVAAAVATAHSHINIIMATSITGRRPMAITTGRVAAVRGVAIVPDAERGVTGATPAAAAAGRGPSIRTRGGRPEA